MPKHRVETINGPVWLDEEPVPLTIEQYAQIALLRRPAEELWKTARPKMLLWRTKLREDTALSRFLEDQQ